MATIHGNSYANTLTGTAYADLVYAYNGSDVVNAGAGNDTVYGAGGNDVINGGAGNDLIVGGTGADYMIGGLGRDTFSFTGNVGDSTGTGDVIGDFRKGEDLVKFVNVSSKTVIQTLEADGDLVIHYGTLGGVPGPNQGTITLEHFGQYLGYSDFVFG